MKKAGLVILFTIICAITFAQAHTYNACCRYGKGNVMGDCVCPGCKKDKQDEIKASQEETKQLQAKAAAEQAKKEAVIKKAKEHEIQKKEAEEKQKYNDLVEGVSENVTEPNVRFDPLIPSGYTAFQHDEYVAIKNGEKLIFKSADHKYIREINKENKYFVLGNPSKSQRENNARVFNSSGKKITIDGLEKFNGVKYNEKENCIYVTVLTGKTTHCLKPFGIPYSEEKIGNAVEYYSGYYTVAYVNLMMKYDASGAGEWAGRCQGYYGEVVVLKLDNSFRLLRKFMGYCKVYEIQ